MFKIICSLLVFIYSLYVGPFAIGGDQTAYRTIYEQMGELSFEDAIWFYFHSINSKEIVHLVFSFIFSSNGIDKDVFIAISNGVLAYVSAAVLLQFNASKIIVVVIILTSFYFNVLYFSAERLKFGFIFLMLSILFRDRKVLFYILSLTSVFGHAQMAINYLAVFFSLLMKEFKRLLVSGKMSKNIFISIFILLIFGVLIINYTKLGFHMTKKFEAYQKEFDFFDIAKILIIMSLTVFYSKKRWEAFFTFVPLVVLVSLLGSDRILMIGYFLFLYYGLQVNRGLNLGVISTTIYFSLKSIGYLKGLIYFGDGFYFL
jgi:hypothetical protein